MLQTETFISLVRLVSLFLALLILQTSLRNVILRHRKKLDIWLDIVCALIGGYWTVYFIGVLISDIPFFPNMVAYMRIGYIVTISALYSFLKGRTTTTIIEDIVKNGKSDYAKSDD